MIGPEAASTSDKVMTGGEGVGGHGHGIRACTAQPHRPDLKSDILTIMDPVRLDLRNKFYLARNYQKRGGQYHFSHDFVYII